MTTDISVSVRWDPATQQEIIDDYDYDGGNSSSRLFERSRIKALAGNPSQPNSLHSLLSLDTFQMNSLDLFHNSIHRFMNKYCKESMSQIVAECICFLI